jgi:hypothetical protein
LYPIFYLYLSGPGCFRNFSTADTLTKSNFVI